MHPNNNLSTPRVGDITINFGGGIHPGGGAGNALALQFSASYPVVVSGAVVEELISYGVAGLGAYAAMSADSDGDDEPSDEPENGTSDQPLDIPQELQEILDNPSLLAGKSPDDVEHLFSSELWRKSPSSKGISGGDKFQLGGTGFTIRWSTGSSERHFQGAYWKISNPNGTPSQLWIGPDGNMYTLPPNPKIGETGKIWEGEITITDHIKRLLDL